MLAECAPGSTWRLATHSRVITYNGRTYRTLPKFDELEASHVRKMVRHLFIDVNCASKHLAVIKPLAAEAAGD